MRDPILLVFANKSDLPGAMPLAEISAKLGLSQLVNRKWNIFSSCAITGDGVEEGFSWLCSQLVNPKGKQVGGSDVQQTRGSMTDGIRT
eukprot:gene3948-4572_t